MNNPSQMKQNVLDQSDRDCNFVKPLIKQLGVNGPVNRHNVLFFFVIISLYISIFSSVAAQSRFPISFSLGAHSLTVPWYPGPITKRFNPASVIGTERTLKTRDKLRFYQTANLGLFQHYWWMTGVYLNSEIGAGYSLPYGLHLDLRLGFGYLHYFWRRKSLELKNGKYDEVTNWGRPSIMIPLSMEFGYHGNSSRPISVAPFLSVQWAIQGLFLDEIPAMTHFMVFVGARVPIERFLPKYKIR